MSKSLRAAFSFLTILPLAHSELEGEELAGAGAWFPLVGFALGLIYWGTAVLLGSRVNNSLLSYLLVLLMAVITGGLHLDGLADFADSLGGINREDRLRIMKDPHKGSFGIIALMLLLAGKFLALNSLLQARSLLPILLAPGLARLSLTMLIATTAYARSQGGTGEKFSRHKKSWHLAVALLCALFPVIALKRELFWFMLLAVMLITFIFRLLGTRLLGGFTGDLLGACVEVCETALLLLAAARSSV